MANRKNPKIIMITDDPTIFHPLSVFFSNPRTMRTSPIPMKLTPIWLMPSMGSVLGENDRRIPSASTITHARFMSDSRFRRIPRIQKNAGNRICAHVMAMYAIESIIISSHRTLRMRLSEPPRVHDSLHALVRCIHSASFGFTFVTLPDLRSYVTSTKWVPPPSTMIGTLSQSPSRT